MKSDQDLDNYSEVEPTKEQGLDPVKPEIPWELQNTGEEPNARLKLKTFLSRKPNHSATILNLVIFLMMSVVSLWFWRGHSFLPGGQLGLEANQYDVFVKGEWWRLFLSQFTHADLGHLLGNSVSFVVFAYFIFGYFGFSAILVSFLGGVLAGAATLLSYDPHTSLIGLSGTVYAMAGVWLVLYLFIERQYSFWSRLLRVIGFTLAVLMPTTYEPQTSYLCHFYGFILGLNLGMIYYGLRSLTRPPQSDSYYQRL